MSTPVASYPSNVNGVMPDGYGAHQASNSPGFHKRRKDPVCSLQARSYYVI
jgi:hypothetical protein